MTAQTRAEPMNSSPHHPKVKVSTTVPGNGLFVAGTHVSGKMEMECRADKGLAIGDMMVELFATQGLSHRGGRKMISQSFYCRVDLQRPLCHINISPQPEILPRSRTSSIECCSGVPRTRRPTLTEAPLPRAPRTLHFSL